jgi:negative regulator of genetic competence, sporulation and motility
MKKIDFVYDIEKTEKFFFAQLSECNKRQYAGLEAMKLGYNGVSELSQKLGINRHTVRKGKKELIEQTVPPTGKIRQKGGGRKKNGSRQRID